jgi:hypothetical protein
LRYKNLQKHARMTVTRCQRMHRAPSCDFSSQTRSTTACRLGGRAFARSGGAFWRGGFFALAAEDRY